MRSLLNRYYSIIALETIYLLALSRLEGIKVWALHSLFPNNLAQIAKRSWARRLLLICLSLSLVHLDRLG